MRIPLPRHRDLVAACAEAVIDQHRTELPDLRAAIILVPDSTQTERIRHCLLTAADADALIPPRITTLKNLFRLRHTSTYLPERASRLLLGTELEKIIHLFHNTNCWQLADKMIPLFNELEEREELDSAPMPLEQESELLNRIYQAWKNANAANVKPGEATCYRRALRENTMIEEDENLFLCGGFDQLSPTEVRWAEKLEHEGRLTIIEHRSEPLPENPKARALALAWHDTEETSLAQRAAECREKLPTSPLRSHLSVLRPETFEQHAVGIQLRIMDWLHEGIANIAVVTQDRKLMRRLRALLEREHIPVYYPAGWAMSTTTSAAALLHLIPDARTGFTSDILTRLARSPYCRYAPDKPSSNTANTEIHHLLSKGIEVIETLDEAVRYICAQKPSPDTAKLVRQIHSTLQPLQKLWNGRQELPFRHFFETLEHAMDKLGMTAKLNADPAGWQIVEALKEMRATAEMEDIQGSWSLWRSWLSHMLETKHFISDTPSQGIGFYDLNQTSLLKPKALILAGLDRAHTQAPARMYMLNDTSRRLLGLAPRTQQLKLLTERFQILAEKADKVLMSCQLSANGCPLVPASWLDELQSFHAIAYADDLTEESVQTIRNAIKTGTQEVASPIPAATSCPKPPAPQGFWPQRFSAQTYSSVMECPYRFFVQYCLKVKTPRKRPGYDDHRCYGTKLHRCLAALHNADELADTAWNQENVDRIKPLAHKIVDRKFSEGSSKHYSAVWDRREATAALENYIDWLIESEIGNAEFIMEHQESRQLAEDFELEGRLDCIIRKPDGTNTIIDYKTGKIPSRTADVQIPFYSILHEDATEAGYLQVKGEQQKKLKARFYGEENLQDLRSQHTQTLQQIKQGFEQCKRLTATPQPKACRHCDYFGVCRISAWGSKQA